MAFQEGISYITCACGKKFQVLNDEGTHWDEDASYNAYYTHVVDCSTTEDIQEREEERIEGV